MNSIGIKSVRLRGGWRGARLPGVRRDTGEMPGQTHMQIGIVGGPAQRCFICQLIMWRVLISAKIRL